jgi:hypothetical protein
MSIDTDHYRQLADGIHVPGDTIDLIAERYRTPMAATYRYLAAVTDDEWAAAQNLYLAALAEWGTGDERTSEAARRYILECDETEHAWRRLTRSQRGNLIAAHRLGDLCPEHMVAMCHDTVAVHGDQDYCPICDRG